ncbi:acetoacetyl-CoA synthetase [Litorivivens lipolytica]|uniref:Acetoacetyl-CoA synthetase n=1 Tax=Litorivivens lipolytica TaxID=1524264 RepID=A0A7W4Z6K4_9GAMM|nr:acetoacetate--CoA ligase [Litorivivens lipolytica]MBB3046996.1 acetoacetyl-CoA synthetase [Litorivivens lipolytica]
MSTPLWTPSAERIAQSKLKSYQDWLQKKHDLSFGDYSELHRWSVDQPAQFWESIWQFCDVKAQQPYDSVLQNGNTFPTCGTASARWFPGAQLNFAENLLRRRDDKTAIIGLLENGDHRTLSYAELYSQVERLADQLKKWGVQKGDRVAGFMPNIPETVIAMLATTSLGAIWSSCSPDFGFQGVMDRFAQIQPKVLFAVEGYFYNGKTLDTRERVAEIAKSLDSIEQVVMTSLTGETDFSGITKSTSFEKALSESPQALAFEPVPFDHPLYIMYSSGTTGTPKCIVHSVGGTLLQHLKEHQLHTDIGEDDVLFYFTTCGWMMWNWLVSGLASSCTLVLFDGSPFAKRGKLLLKAIDQEGITVFGTSAKFIASLEKAGHKPKDDYRLDSLKAILSTGSPLSHESFDYVYRDFKRDVCLSSISGGTDIVSCFVLGNPTLPVYKGQIQCVGLGMAVEIWNDEGRPVTGEKGELVCIKPFPCSPIGFWNDEDGSRFHKAYFAQFDNIWAHGDYGEITAEGGVVIHGRSDSVLNPGGVRIGTAEIYRQVEKIDEVLEAIVIGQNWEDDVRVVLFVVLREDISLTEELIQTIKTTIRKNTTPRHVPAKVLQVADIPRTISGKIVELAVRNVVHGEPVKNTDALANPEALGYFRNRPELMS